MELSGHVAIVTGAGRGIGRATALELAGMGADIVVAELDLAGAERTAAEIKGLGRRVSAVKTDVTSRADLTAMANRARAEFGRIDILVNNAGIYRAALPLDITEEHWDAIMNVNAKAVFFATQAVLPAMIAQKRGAIVSLASMAGKIGSRTNLPYNASKAAVVSMTKSLALAHAADGIRVNCVCPGFVETDMWTSVASEQGKLMGMSADEFTRLRAGTVRARPHGAAGRRRQCHRLSRLEQIGLHDRPGAERRRRPRHALKHARPPAIRAPERRPGSAGTSASAGGLGRPSRSPMYINYPSPFRRRR